MNWKLHTQTIHRNNYTGPRCKKIQGNALQGTYMYGINFSNLSIAINIQKEYSFAPHQDESENICPGYIYLKKCSVYMSPPATSSYQYSEQFYHLCPE